MTSTDRQDTRTVHWAIAKIDDTYKVIDLDSGNRYDVTRDGDILCCRTAYQHGGGRCRAIRAVIQALSGQLDVDPIIVSDERGITATFLDGTGIALAFNSRPVRRHGMWSL